MVVTITWLASSLWWRTWLRLFEGWKGPSVTAAIAFYCQLLTLLKEKVLLLKTQRGWSIRLMKRLQAHLTLLLSLHLLLCHKFQQGVQPLKTQTWIRMVAYKPSC